MDTVSTIFAFEDIFLLSHSLFSHSFLSSFLDWVHLLTHQLAPCRPNRCLLENKYLFSTSTSPTCTNFMLPKILSRKKIGGLFQQGNKCRQEMKSNAHYASTQGLLRVVPPFCSTFHFHLFIFQACGIMLLCLLAEICPTKASPNYGAGLDTDTA